MNKRSKTRVNPLPPGSFPCPPRTGPTFVRRAFRAHRAAREELVWAKKQKHEEPRSRRGRRRRRERKKRAEMAPHVQRVFGASPGAVGKLLFSAPFPSPSRPPLLGSPSRTSRASRFPSRCPRFTGFPRTIRTLARPTSLLFLYLLLHPSSSPRTPGPSISSPTVPRYPVVEKRKRKRKGEQEKREKNTERAGVPTKCEIRVCQNGRWRFSLKPMGD